MSRTMQFVLDNDDYVYMELTELDVGESNIDSDEPDFGYDNIDSATGFENGAISQKGNRFRSAVKKIVPVANEIYEALETLSPNEIEVEFGVKFTAATNILITSGGAEAHYTVRMRWNKN